jgi:hypothetical protein
MKSRLFIRALCVGAALLVPAGGLTTLGTTTAGATTNQELLIGKSPSTMPSTIKLGSLGSATLSGEQCLMGGTVCQFTTLGPIIITKNGTTKSIFALPNFGSIKVTQTRTNLVITAASIRVDSFTLKGLTFTKCKITGIPATALSLSSGKWKATTVSMSGVSISTTGGTCTKKSTLTTDFTTKLRVSLILTTKAI